MSDSHRHGFTLVEVLTVVVILGILAAVVIANFNTTTTDAVKSTLLRQLQHVDHQVELYRAANWGQLPSSDANPLEEGGANGGWGVMVSEDYLRREPLNPYTGATSLMAGDRDAAIAADTSAEVGWYVTETPSRMEFFAAGFNDVTNELHHEMAAE